MSCSSATSGALRPERTGATALSLNSWIKLRLCFFVVVIGVRLLAHLMSHLAVQAHSIYGAYVDTQRMVLNHDGYKLIHYPPLNVFGLFNIHRDPWEMNDLAGNPQYLPKLESLILAHTDLRKDLNDPLVAGEGFKK